MAKCVRWCGFGLAVVQAWACAATNPGSRVLFHWPSRVDPNAASVTAGTWAPWSPRAELSPRFTIEPRAGRAGGAALRISTRDGSDFGAWRTQVEGVTGGRTYRFSAWYRARNVMYPRRSVIARLEWLDEKGQPARPPDYALDVGCAGSWTQVQYLAPTPTNARRVDLQLALGFASKATVWWDDIQLVEEPAPPDRVVRALTVFHRPRNTRSAAESVEQFCRLVEPFATSRVDLVCLPEGITVVGTGKSYAEVSEPVPGPTTERLGALARKLGAYVVAGLYERAGKVVYNTAVLIDRRGQLVGAYRKTHLPREEWERGITPGDRYPVFETDFGKLGILICWDLQFPEAARALGLQGAEVICLPIWGGSEVLARARTIENCLFLVSATYDMRSFIVDPAGRVLAEATAQQPVATAELHLDRPIYQPWLGDMKTRTWKERRPDIPLPNR